MERIVRYIYFVLVVCFFPSFPAQRRRRLSALVRRQKTRYKMQRYCHEINRRRKKHIGHLKKVEAKRKASLLGSVPAFYPPIAYGERERESKQNKLTHRSMMVNLLSIWWVISSFPIGLVGVSVDV